MVSVNGGGGRGGRWAALPAVAGHDPRRPQPCWRPSGAEDTSFPQRASETMHALRASSSIRLRLSPCLPSPPPCLPSSLRKQSSSCFSAPSPSATPRSCTSPCWQSTSAPSSMTWRTTCSAPWPGSSIHQPRCLAGRQAPHSRYKSPSATLESMCSHKSADAGLATLIAARFRLAYVCGCFGEASVLLCLL